jgi:DNA-binding CsgD family transcriptional regulator
MLVKFSEKERAIIELIAQGKSDKEISEITGIKIQVVKNINMRIRFKCGVKSTRELIAKYYQGGIPCLQTLCA